MFEDTIKSVAKGMKDCRYIIFQPTTWCNYHCSYCIQGMQKDAKPSQEELRAKAEELRMAINKIDHKVTKKYEKITFLGGEVAFYDMFEILEPLISDKTIEICMTSNGSAPTANYYAFSEKCAAKGINVHYVFSFHEEHTSPEAFLNKVKMMQKHFIIHKELKSSIRCQITVTDTNVDICRQFLSMAKKNGIFATPGLERKSRHFTNDYEDIYHTREAKELVTQYTRNENPSLIAEFTNGKIERIRREDLLSRCEGSILKTGKFICTDRFNTVRYQNGTIQLNCKIKEDIMEEEDEVKCPYDTCSLCGSVNIKKA